MKPRFLKGTYKLTFLLIILIAISSCTLIPGPYYSDLDNFDEKPENKQLIGQYQLDIEPPASRAQAQLVLKKDSTFILKDVPVGVLKYFYSDYTKDHNNLENITGNWKVSENKDDSNFSVKIQLRNIDEKLDNISKDWKLYEKDNKPVVSIILGVPDSCETLNFIKRNTVDQND